MADHAIPEPHLHHDEPLIDVKAVAARLNCSQTSVWRLVRAGALPTVKLGALTRFAPADVRALIAGHRTVKPARAA